ncbi:group 1 truncated hemoglobin [Methylomonas sp. UP202]|uniref:group I truncated hemoglobin n=1 Tax=Methylomonas sp. UP202 TaxID=3040943 RepID=UPI0024784285|nr:group 1 truncated hemoglobin [Methylomonas sp. UP202]WGS83969.1 group 1 truncated hemoglobin [Methylomonas sp. UP202]
MSGNTTLYARLGGYDAIAAVVSNLLARLMTDSQLGRFWKNRGEDGIAREKQLLINYLCANSGGQIIYTGRDNATSHRGMKISENDWGIFIKHLELTLQHFNVASPEYEEVLSFVQSNKVDIVEIP